MNSKTLLQKVLRTVRKHGMIAPGDRVLVAVSGGPDSTALLHVLHQLRDKLGCDLHVAHFNHGIRGSEADEDERSVRALARSMHVPFVSARAAEELTAVPRPDSLEEAARRARYEFLEEAAGEIGAARIATGHTMDDQAETILMRLVQGTGPGGLAGIRPVLQGRIVRPLIECRSGEIAHYLDEAGLAPRTDSSNQDPAFLRNRIRLRLLPLIEREFNPRIVEALARTASVERDVDGYLGRRAEEALAGCAEVSSDKIRLALGPFADYDVALQSYILRAAVLAVRGRLTDVSYEHVRNLLEMACGRETPFRQITLPGSLTAYRERGFLVLSFEEPRPACHPQEIRVPGTTRLTGFGLEIRTSLMPASQPERPAGSDRDRARFDWDRLRPPLVIRGWQPGDRIHPAGMRGRKKIQDFFVDAKVPRRVRDRTPLLADRRAIHWIIGHRTSELSRVTECTTHILEVKAVPLDG